MSNLANVFKFSELWNASSNTPRLNASSCASGSWYIVSHPGTTNLTGPYSINAVHTEGSNNGTVPSTAADLASWRMGDALVCIYTCMSKCNTSVVVVNSTYSYTAVTSPNATYAHMWFKLANPFTAPKPKLYKRYWDMDNVAPVCCSDSALVPLLAMEPGSWIWARAVEGGPSNRTLVFPPSGSVLQHDPYLTTGDYFEVDLMLGNSGAGLLCLVMGDGAVLEGLFSPLFDQNGCMPGHQSAWHVTLRFEVACVRPEHERMTVRPVKAFPVSLGEWPNRM
jgi:hypothetical protein